MKYSSGKIGCEKPAPGCKWRSIFEPGNILALLALALLYAQVRDSSLALRYLKQAADTGEADLSDVASDPEFEFLWNDPTFERIVSANGRA